MAAPFSDKAFYAQHFDPKGYLETYYSFSSEKEAEKALITFTLNALHKTFTVGGIKGDTLIDIGSGPTIYQYLSACESFQEIIATDYTDGNREEMQRWLRKEPAAFDWRSIVKYVCELEGDREKWAQKEEKVRRSIKRLLKCDVTQPNPLAPLSLPPADCLLSTYCLEVASKDLPAFRSALKNIGSLLKPGGHLILATTLEFNFFMIGQCRFGCLYLEQEDLEKALKEAGFDIEWLEATRISLPLSSIDVKGLCIVVALKR
ncbi:nicotinamide N-methyltransferase-like [Eublepharis macularius]|uniref:Nicotinamide N-methyltransferase-like n=1 Tax=Eublepharis macularius TaxID=481883 RepID=A0AA97KAK0_EUBMA|nr:nicotinamide N-methyltransferase-like [Eublepharis macularius]